MRTITIANQKGGCGKTTVAINLSASLAREGRRVLLVDLDPQAHCALGMAVPEEQIDLSILDCLLRQIDGEPLELFRITWQIAPNLDLVPSRPNLATLEPKLGAKKDADTLMRNLLTANAGRYDYCVVDCPPYLGLLMRNALRAASDIIIPVDTGYFSLYGLTQQLATIDHLGQRNGFKPSVRVLANQYDVRTKLGREILAELRKRFQGVVYEAIINFNTKLKEGASFGQPITEFAPNSIGARDFQKLAREVIAREPSKIPTTDILQHVEKLTADAERLLATTAVLVDKRTDQTTDPIPPTQALPGATALSSATPPMMAEHQTRRSSSSAPVSPSVPASSTPRKGPASDSAQASNTPIATRLDMAVAATTARSTPLQGLGIRDQESGRRVGPAAQAGETRSRRPGHIPDPRPPTTIRQAAASVASPSKIASQAEIDRKIKVIYGARQEGDVMIFRSHRPGANEVQLAGDFNDWMPHTTPMRRLADGDFEARLRLPKGRYRYRLVIDGRWSHDQHNPAVETNEYGELNSIVTVTR